jgi:predicted transcriptional regulator
MIRKSLSELREEMRGVARGERHASALPAAPLLAILTPEAMELLGVLPRERPSSISELVARTGRAQPNISRSLQLLARHNLVRLVREGREVRPEPVAREVRVNLITGTYEMTAAAA